MAQDVNNSVSRSGTIAFTLPISCQICLGKVKQPVLCPNNHVFCSSCLDTWLERNQQCPSCRTVIDEAHPCKQILGGINPATESEDDTFTNPELRKARFEVLFKEYESEFAKLQTHTAFVSAENSVLRQHLDKTNVKLTDAPPKQKSLSAQEIDGLAVLTKKLNEATKLYNKIKGDMDKIKKENTILKDQNIDLTRENERLRTEITSRSPHKYGRLTVATMQTKLDEYEKQVNQLNLALEKSDGVIEELETELNFHRKNSKTVNSLVSRDCLTEGQNIKGEKQFSDNFGQKGLVNGARHTEMEVDNFDDYGAKTKNATHGFNSDNTSKSLTGSSSKKLPIGSVTSSFSKNTIGKPSNSNAITSNRNLVIGERNSDMVSDIRSEIKNGIKSSARLNDDESSEMRKNTLQRGMNSADKKLVDLPQRSNNKPTETHRKRLFLDDYPQKDVNTSMDMDVATSSTGNKMDLMDTPTKKKAGILVQKTVDSPSKSGKKVKFSLPSKIAAEVSSSFDLDVPSPMNSEMVVGKTTLGLQRQRFDDAIITRAMEKVTAREIDFRNMDIDSMGDTAKHVEKSNKYDPDVDQILGRSNDLYKSGNYNNYSDPKPRSLPSKMNISDESLGSSCLELPDTGNSAVVMNASDELTDTFTLQNELDDLNISMTPEFKDCLKLFHKAEKNVHKDRPSDSYNHVNLHSTDPLNSRTGAKTAATRSSIDASKGSLKFSSLPNLRSQTASAESNSNYPSKLRHDDILDTSGIVFAHLNDKHTDHNNINSNNNNTRNSTNKPQNIPHKTMESLASDNLYKSSSYSTTKYSSSDNLSSFDKSKYDSSKHSYPNYMSSTVNSSTYTPTTQSLSSLSHTITSKPPYSSYTNATSNGYDSKPTSMSLYQSNSAPLTTISYSSNPLLSTTNSLTSTEYLSKYNPTNTYPTRSDINPTNYTVKPDSFTSISNTYSTTATNSIPGKFSTSYPYTSTTYSMSTGTYSIVTNSNVTRSLSTSAYNIAPSSFSLPTSSLSLPTSSYNIAPSSHSLSTSSYNIAPSSYAYNTATNNPNSITQSSAYASTLHRPLDQQTDSLRPSTNYLSSLPNSSTNYLSSLPNSSTNYLSSLPTTSTNHLSNLPYPSTNQPSNQPHFPTNTLSSLPYTSNNISTLQQPGHQATSNYSYLSNASLNSDLSSKLDDSFLLEPKKRLFDGEIDDSYTLGPMKVTKTVR